MVERKPYPLAASSSLADWDTPDPRAEPSPATVSTSLADLPWPPPGWPMFSCVNHTSGRAIGPTQPRTGDHTYIAYEVSGDADGIYTVEILSGTHGRNGSSLSAAIGMRFAARDDWFDDNPGAAIMEMHVGGQRLLPERGSVLRMILAITFMISRIDRGMAPNLRRVLRMYRLG